MNPTIGEIRAFAGNYAPAGWHICDGSLLPIANNEVLYSLISTTYGGDGRTTVGLPDLRGRQALNQGQGPGRTNRILGQNGGAETVTLTQAEMAAHTHTVKAVNAVSNTSDPTGNYLAGPVDQTTQTTATVAYLPNNFATKTVVPLDSSTVTSEGGSQPHENRMPYMPITYIICLVGLYPQSN